MKIIKSRGPEVFDIELEKDILAKNKSLAKENRKRFDRSDILTIHLPLSIIPKVLFVVSVLLLLVFPTLHFLKVLVRNIACLLIRR